MAILICQEAGLAIMPDYLTDAGVASGVLQVVLPKWIVVPVGVYAVWPPNAL